MDEHETAREAGRRLAREMAPISAESARRIAELLREPVNQLARERRLP